MRKCGAAAVGGCHESRGPNLNENVRMRRCRRANVAGCGLSMAGRLFAWQGQPCSAPRYMATKNGLLLLGNGAVKDGWNPVIEALNGVVCAEVCSPDGANFAMARLVYIARELSRGVSEDHEKYCVPHREALTRLRSAKKQIAAELSKTEVSVRPEFQPVVTAARAKVEGGLSVVTTNWDRSVEAAASSLGLTTEVRYLHGSVCSPQALFLPSEMADEPYRTSEEKNTATNERGALATLVDESDLIVVYGLSVSALDAELGQVLASGMAGAGMKTVWVIDPQYPFVCERVDGLLDPESGSRVEGSHPGRLKRTWQFSATGFEAELSLVKKYENEIQESRASPEPMGSSRATGSPSSLADQ